MRADPSGWRTRLDTDTEERYRTNGAWEGQTVADQLVRLAAAQPKQALYLDDTGALTVSETLDHATRLANALAHLGLKRGDVVSFQLPNWREAAIIDLASCLAGYVCNPIVPIYRDAEVGFILADARSKVFFIPAHFKTYDFGAMMARLRTRCPDLRHVVVVRGQGDESSYDALLAETASGQLIRPDPNDVKLLLYTSGTTSAPKGVLHTHNTVNAEVRAFSTHLKLTKEDVILMPSTLCHVTGYIYGIQMPILLGARAVLMEAWDASRAADLIECHAVTFTIGATPFLRELAQFAEQHDRALPTLRLFPTGGAPVPPDVVRHAERAFAHCRSFRVFGSTEAPTITLGELGAASSEERATTEGRVVGHEVKVIRPDGETARSGESGEIVARGPEVCVGYTDWEQNDAFDDEGFFHTGDLGHFTSDGYLVITGRAKDIIIRGGENISPKELEDVLYKNPGIRLAAVVSMFHPRLGETCCAYVTLSSNAGFDLHAMRALFAASGVAKQKWPERLEVVSEMPTTAAGKIRKNLLREDIAGKLAAERVSH